MRFYVKWVIAIVLAAIVTFPALAQTQGDYPHDIEIEAREVGRQLRCVVCQNQSIEESDAPLAADMRVLVRDRLVAGDSEADIIALMRDRYGDYVLLLPPVQSNTLILWGAPIGFIILFLIWWLLSIRRKPTPSAATSLSDNDTLRLAELRKVDP